jgi:signal transduction histidine kinase
MGGTPELVVGLTACQSLGSTPMPGEDRPSTVSGVDEQLSRKHEPRTTDSRDTLPANAVQIVEELLNGARAWFRPSTWRDFAGLVLWCVSSCVGGLITLGGLLASLVTVRTAAAGIPARAAMLRLLAEMVDVDRRRIAHFSGARIQPLALPRTEPDASRTVRQQSWAQSPMRSRLPAYALIRVPIVTAAAVGTWAWWWGTILGFEMSIRRLELGFHRVHSDYGLYHRRLRVLGVALRPWHLSWIEAVALLLVGVGVGVLLWPKVQRALSSIDVALARSLPGWLHGPSTTELSREVVRLSETRAQAVTAADAERRRIERDLHDGFQPQLVNLALNLGLARSRLATDPDAARSLLDRAHEDAKRATEDLRNIVRGIHPSVLDERGLDAAFSALAASSGVRLQIDVHLDHRPPRGAEGIAYFVVAEAVTNVNKHAHAHTATITVSEIEGSLRVLVQDDGEGGARPEPGGGLVGLADRIAGVDGTFSVTSPDGGPTWIEARIPCER